MDSAKRCVLITGVAHYWGNRLARTLEKDPGVDSLLGIDVVKPKKPFDRLEFFEVTPDNPLMAELFAAAKVDTVFHLLFEDTYTHDETVFDINVMGAMDILGACSAAKVPRLVVMSDTRVYGAKSANPGFIKEDAELAGKYRHPYVQQRYDVERVLDRYSRKNELPGIAVLRFANVVGPSCDSPMCRYFDSTPVPTVLGFDPMFQFTHEDDVEAALHKALYSDAAGPVNVAGDKPLPLSQAMRLGGRVVAPMSASVLKVSGAVAQRTVTSDRLSIEPSYLKYACVGETVRMREELGFVPEYTSKEAVKRYFEYLRVRRYKKRARTIRTDPESERRLHEYIDQKRGGTGKTQASAEPTTAGDYGESSKQ
ncbi:MAG: NAD-dependent epimerase/dehydratase family protein [Desulfatibacillaceae bacterium]